MAPLFAQAVALPVLLDGLSVNVTLAGTHVVLSDRVTFLKATPTQRSYKIAINSTLPLPTAGVYLETNPLAIIADPSQLPGGPDALPPANDWRWVVFNGHGVNDTLNWSTPRWTHDLGRTTSWTNQTFFITCVVDAVVPFTVDLPLANATASPGVGVVLDPGTVTQGPLWPANDTDYARMVAGLKPTLMRFGVVDAGTGAWWDSVHNVPVFNFSAVDRTFNLSKAIGASVLYSITSGSWGDGNLLPTGMPVNTTYLITKGATSGYFPTPGAYRTYVQVLVNHTFTMNQTVKYWTVGNEQPLTNYSVVNEFIQLYNIAAGVIHSYYPNALVGSDVMTTRSYFSDFAQNATGVGFLSYHFYPAIGLCTVNGTYCPPQGPGNGTLDARLWQPVADIAHVGFYAPHLAQQMWYNATGNWLPIFDAESNLNGIGGGAASGANGSDPRQQTLLGAAWSISTMMRSAQENVSTFTYYAMTGPATVPQTLSGPYGGWGFGLSSEGLTDNDTKYAPYWALHLWGQNVPAGHPGTVLPSPDSLTARAYAVQTANGINVVLASLVATRVTMPVLLNATGYFAKSVTTLDGRSYEMTFNATLNSTSLLRSGVTTWPILGSPSKVSVTLDGYGVAVVHFLRAAGVHPGGLRSPGVHRCLLRASALAKPGHSVPPFEVGSTSVPPSLGFATARMGPLAPGPAVPASFAPTTQARRLLV